jgi:hypothetical protein
MRLCYNHAKLSRHNNYLVLVLLAAELASVIRIHPPIVQTQVGQAANQQLQLRYIEHRNEHLGNDLVETPQHLRKLYFVTLHKLRVSGARASGMEYRTVSAASRSESKHI